MATELSCPNNERKQFIEQQSEFTGVSVTNKHDSRSDVFNIQSRKYQDYRYYQQQSD